MRPIKSLVFAIAMLSQLACSQAFTEISGKPIPQGAWGGDHLVLTVRADGADFEFDCATGHIRVPLTVNRKGGFRVKGNYQIERPAPMRADNPGTGDGSEVLYTGKLKGNQLKVAVTLPGNDRPSVFHLVRDREPNLTKCM